MNQFRILALAASCLLWTSCRSSQKASETAAKDRVQKLPALLVQRERFRDSTAGLADVEGQDQIELRTEAAGKVREVAFREGGAVGAGQLVVALDDAEARASRDRAQARLRLAAAFVVRVREQVRAQAASLQQQESAQADSAVAAADLALAEAALAKTRVRAPFAGKAGLRGVQVGQLVGAGQLVTTLVGGGAPRLVWALPEGMAARIAPGQELRWRDPALGAAGTAAVQAVAPALDPHTRTRPLVARCRTGCDALVAGGTVEMVLPTDTVPTLSIPAQALTGSAKGSGVFVLRSGKAALVSVAVGRRNAERVEILSGLDAGDTVLVGGATSPKAGAPVEIARLLEGRADSGKAARSGRP